MPYLLSSTSRIFRRRLNSSKWPVLVNLSGGCETGPAMTQPSPSHKAVLQHAAALQDHFARLLLMPGRLPLPAGSSPTLGQRLKLVAGPVAPLTPQRWQAVHAQSLYRGDSQHECSICLQAFRAEPQVLLSCSHVFHTRCLQSFEKYTQTRCCPLCRCQAYQKKQIEDGARFYREQCATRIQAAYRGHRARKQFLALRELVPPQDPSLQRRWVAGKLQRHTDRLVGVVQHSSSVIDVLFAELDATARGCAAVYSQLDARRPPSGRRGAPAMAPAALPAPAQAGGGPSYSAGPTTSAAMASGGAVAAEGTARDGNSQVSVDWELVIAKALERDEDPECPICLAKLAPQQAAAPVAAAAAAGARARSSETKGSIAILTCSHAFHCDCLALFEAFQVASEMAPRCPCCRAQYSRIELK